MNQVGFDSEKYIRLQSEHIRERINQFGGKLYLEFGGKLFDDYHASRVLPGFAPDNKIKMLLALRDQAEIVIAINAGDIEKNKRRGDLGITYDTDVARLIDVFRGFGLYVGSIALTRLKSACRRSASRFTVNTAFPIIPPTCGWSSATKAMAAMIILKPRVRWSS